MKSSVQVRETLAEISPLKPNAEVLTIVKQCTTIHGNSTSGKW